MVPEGTYLVSDTIGWPRRTHFLGQRQSKTIIKLKDSCPGFSDAAKGKPVLHTGIPGRFYDNDSQQNAAFNNYILNLTVDTGKGNPGAIGVRYTTHNEGVLGEVTVRSGDGQGKCGVDLAQTEFGPGLLRNVTVEGFRTGINTLGNCSHATMAGISLKGQGEVGIINRFPISLEGLTSVNQVPAVRNEGGMANLVIVNASLSGGLSSEVAIDVKDGAGYLRNIRTSGYRAAAAGKGVPETVGAVIRELAIGAVQNPSGGPKTGLNLPIIPTPPPFVEPLSAWAIVPESGDATKNIQAAIDGGAQTICLKWGKSYNLSDTVHVRGKVRRITAEWASVGGSKQVFVDAKKPMFRFDGDGKEPITIEWLSPGIYPYNKLLSFEIATAQPLYFKSCGFRCYATTPEARGTVVIDEGIQDSLFTGPEKVYLRQLNTENNPFTPGKSDCMNRKYITNIGSDVCVLGWKTEAPAWHAITSKGGRTEVLGGFFRDHFGPKDYNADIPYFMTEDASVSASYYQYAWAPGKARAVQAIEVRGGRKIELRVDQGNYSMGLYAGINPDAAPAQAPAPAAAPAPVAPANPPPAAGK